MRLDPLQVVLTRTYNSEVKRLFKRHYSTTQRNYLEASMQAGTTKMPEVKTEQQILLHTTAHHILC